MVASMPLVSLPSPTLVVGSLLVGAVLTWAIQATPSVRRVLVFMVIACVIAAGAVFATPVVRPAFWVVCPPFGFLYILLWCWL